MSTSSAIDAMLATSFTNKKEEYDDTSAASGRNQPYIDAE